MKRTAGVLLASALGLLAAGEPAPAQEITPLDMRIFELDNGLDVILVEDHSTQVVATEVWYDVGSRVERPGRSGFAHLFEHMMFQGSEHVGKMEHVQRVSGAGGETNGTTTEDRTKYYNILPSNQLGLALWLEADRMRSLAVTAENFENQRAAVKEEVRLKVENPPYSAVFMNSMYDLYAGGGCPGYGHSVFGSLEDLDAATIEDVRLFYRQYYAPDNAALVVSGDFDPARAERLIRDYFGGIAVGADRPAPPPCDPEPIPTRRREVVDARASLPAVIHGYRVPAFNHPDYPALELITEALAVGEASILNRELVRTGQAAGMQVGLNPQGPRRGPGVLQAFVIASGGRSAEQLDAALSEVIARVAREGLTADELERARNRLRTQAVSARQQPWQTAVQVQKARLFLGDPEAADRLVTRHDDVTMEDIREAAARYLVDDNRLVTLVKTEAAR